MREAEARGKKKLQELATNKTEAVLEETKGKEPEAGANDFQIDF